MKNAKDLFKNINEVLDGYHYYSYKEVKENEELFISAINSNDIDYINKVISLFDTHIEEEKQIVDNINFLMVISGYVISIGGNNELVEQIINNLSEYDNNITMKEVKEHIENYYL